MSVTGQEQTLAPRIGLEEAVHRAREQLHDFEQVQIYRTKFDVTARTDSGSAHSASMCS